MTWVQVRCSVGGLDPNDLGLEAENAVAFSPDLREAQVRPSYAFGELFELCEVISGTRHELDRIVLKKRGVT